MKLKTIDLKNTLRYYKKGFFPALELTIRNLAYIFVILQVALQLGENDFNTWNMAGYIYWVVILRIVIVFDYYLISESTQGKTNSEISKLVTIMAFIEFLIFFVLGILLSLFYLP